MASGAGRENVGDDKLESTLRDIERLRGCECDQYCGHTCLMCQVREIARKGLERVDDEIVTEAEQSVPLIAEMRDLSHQDLAEVLEAFAETPEMEFIRKAMEK